jgi:flagellar biosynthetic protein FlhB
MSEKDQSSEEKTLQPTPKKLEKAYEEGKNAFSPELGNWFFLLGILVFMSYILPDLLKNTIISLRFFFQNINHDFKSNTNIFREKIIDFFFPMMGMYSTLLFFGVFGNLIQTYKTINVNNIKFDFSRLSWAKGVKKIIGSQTIINGIKTIGKFMLLSFAFYFFFDTIFEKSFQWIFLDEYTNARNVKNLSIKFLWNIFIIFTVIAMIDFSYHYYQFWKMMRMGIQELKDELKNEEVSILVRQRIRQIRDKIQKQNLANAVPEATAVIVNPTHFSVAIRWDEKTMQAPMVVAKGKNVMAKQIREIARKNNVPIIHNPPLARGLYDDIGINSPITFSYYQAIAQIIQKITNIKTN